jgi:hypothetical protein
MKFTQEVTTVPFMPHSLSFSLIFDNGYSLLSLAALFKLTDEGQFQLCWILLLSPMFGFISISSANLADDRFVSFIEFIVTETFNR